MVANLLRDPVTDPRDLILRPGYIAYLATLKAYNPSKLLPPPLVQVWESLLSSSRSSSSSTASAGPWCWPNRGTARWSAARCPAGPSAGGGTRLSPATRPLDFLEPWVVDPRVERFGMIYDISDFSQSLSVLHRAGTESQDDAFRKMFRFQRRINRLAMAHRVQAGEVPRRRRLLLLPRGRQGC